MAQVKNEDSSIDKARSIPREDGWLLSTSTAVFSKMDLSKKPLPPLPSHHLKGSLNSRHPNRPGIYRTSTSSESSDLGIDTCWSGSDTTVDDPKLSETECWDSYFWSQDKEIIPRPLFQAEPDLTVTSPFQQSNLSPYNRNFASTNLLGLSVNGYPAELRRSDATRTPRRTPRSLPHNTYSPFPPVSPSQRYPASDSAHKSWPLHSGPQSKSLGQPPLRDRAHTTPAKYNPLPPSNLSTCSTLDDRNSPCHSSTSSASGLYMRSAPVSPEFALPLMDLMEKSCFEDDSDDEPDEEGKLAAFAARLHIRSASANNPAPGAKKERGLRSQKSRRNLKIAGDKVKGILRMKKSSEAV